MKSIIILGALIISAGAFAQTQQQMMKEVEKGHSQLKEQTQTVQKDINDKADQTKEQISKMDGEALKTEAKDLINKVKAEGQEQEELVDDKVSEVRAEEAKVKATQAKTEAEADKMIETSKEETKATLGSIDEKMGAARQKLTDKLASGELTQAQFDEKTKQLIDFDKRRGAIVSKLK